MKFFGNSIKSYWKINTKSNVNSKYILLFGEETKHRGINRFIIINKMSAFFLFWLELVEILSRLVDKEVCKMLSDSNCIDRMLDVRAHTFANVEFENAYLGMPLCCVNWIVVSCILLLFVKQKESLGSHEMNIQKFWHEAILTFNL